MACRVSRDRDRTSLSLSFCLQSTPAPADQVGPLRWNCGSYHHSRVNRTTVSLSFAWASWLILSAYHSTCLYRYLAHLPTLLRPCHSALPALGRRPHHQPHAGLRHAHGLRGGTLRAGRRRTGYAAAKPEQPASLAAGDRPDRGALPTPARTPPASHQSPDVRGARYALPRHRAPGATPG